LDIGVLGFSCLGHAGANSVHKFFGAHFRDEILSEFGNVGLKNRVEPPRQEFLDPAERVIGIIGLPSTAPRKIYG
jgi:hypothetical protein